MDNTKKTGDAELAAKVIEAFKDFDGITDEECSDIGLDGQQCSALKPLSNYGMIDAQSIFVLQDKGFSNKFISTLAGNNGSGLMWAKAKWLQKYGVSDASPAVRVKACEELERIGRLSSDFPQMLPIFLDGLKYLIEALKDKSPEVRIAAAKAIASVRHNAKDAIPALVEVLDNDDSASVRAAAANAIAGIGLVEKGVIGALKKALKDKSTAVRKAAAYALATINLVTKDAVPALKKALKDNDEWVRSYAASALGNAGHPSAVPALIKALKKDPSGRVRASAAGALGEIGPAAKAAVPALIDALKKYDDKETREEAIVALGNIGPAAKGALPLLKSISKNDLCVFVRNKAKEAVEKIEAD
jgi:hypothetical protein